MVSLRLLAFAPPWWAGRRVRTMAAYLPPRRIPSRPPFGVSSTAAEVIDGVDLSGRRVVVTGGASGLGAETARALAAAGAQGTLAVRDPSAGRSTADAITTATGRRTVHDRPLDLSDLGSVAAFAASWDGPLDVLVNNAGVMALPQLQHSAAGSEMQFAINHLGHFALAVGLHDALAATGGARIVSVSSLVHLASPV